MPEPEDHHVAAAISVIPSDTELVMKMRSWSIREGIMLVPSTLTG